MGDHRAWATSLPGANPVTPHPVPFRCERKRAQRKQLVVTKEMYKCNALTDKKKIGSSKPPQ